MSSTLLRFGLWIVLIALAFYVIHETFPEAPQSEYISAGMLQKVGAVGVGMVLLGFVLGLFQKAAAKAFKQRCTVCRRPIPHGEIYCREHLRKILEEEDERIHGMRLPR